MIKNYLSQHNNTGYLIHLKQKGYIKYKTCP